MDINEQLNYLKNKIDNSRKDKIGKRILDLETKKEIVFFLRSTGKPYHYLKDLKISSSSFFDWNKQYPEIIPPPKKLTIQGSFEKISHSSQMKVSLPNGVVLENIELNIQNLKILRSI